MLVRVLVVCAACAMACGGDKDKAKNDEAPKGTEGEAKPEGEGEDRPKADPKPSGGVPADWKPRENADFGWKVMAPVEAEELNMDNDLLRLRAFQFKLSDSAFGQVMYASYLGEDEFDIKTGLDGACKQSVAGVGGTMTDYKELEVDGKMARDFRFTAEAEGIGIKGLGRGVATGPKTVVAVIAFAEASKGASAWDLAEAFVKSFEAK